MTMNKRPLSLSKRWPYRKQLMVLFVTAVLGLGITSSISTSWQSTQIFISYTTDLGQQIARTFADRSTLAILYASADNASEATDAILAFPQVVHAAIYDMDGERLMGRGEHSGWSPERQFGMAVNDVTIAPETDANWHFVASIFARGEQGDGGSPFSADYSTVEKIGYVHVVMNKKRMHKVQRDIFISGLLWTLSFTMLVLLIVNWKTRRLIKPLNDLELLMRQAQEGNRSIRASADGALEVARMGLAFNDMMHVLDERAVRLNEQNSRLRSEIGRREHVEHELIAYRDHLKEMVDSQTKDLVEARDAALGSERSMSTFLANMSHELRTPLHGILSFSRFGVKKTETVPREKLKGYFQEIRESAQGLLELVSNLLDLSKLRAGKMTYEFKRSDIIALLYSLQNEFSAIFQEVGINSTVDTEGREELFVDMDRKKIGQVIRNLLSNSVRYSPDESTIDISINEEVSGMVLVTISDHGVGIPEDELGTIFNAFSQSSATRNKAGGTGLGLSICKEIIEAGHGGLIKGCNRVGGGAEFVFSFPIKHIA